VPLQLPERHLLVAVAHDHLVYTGTIDGFFDHRFGKLPYRSLEFELKNEPTPGGGLLQPVASVNEPDFDVPYTRTTEYRHMTGQVAESSSFHVEYPRAEGDPYYPIPNDETKALYKRYERLAAELPDVTFVGRLARYQYLDMHQVVAQALTTFEKLASRLAAAA